MSQTPLTQLCEINPAQPKGRAGQEATIAPVAVFLASDESRWVTCDTLAVSGGL
jgi:3-oxoacyl-[acyl-carrier protein] reductase